MKKIKFVNELNNQKGITAADVTISALIILVAVSVIGMVYTNLVITSRGVDRKAEATRIATNIIENISSMYYDEIEEELNTLSDDGIAIKTIETDYTNYHIANGQGEVELFNVNILNGYEADIIINNVFGSENENDGLDLVKKVTVQVSYLLNGISQNVNIEQTFKREAVRECNSPVINDSSFESFDVNMDNCIYWYENAQNFSGDYIICPIEYDVQNELYKLVPSSVFMNNKRWYSYSNKQWARVLILTPGQYGNVVDSQNNVISDNSALTSNRSFLWIPKFGIDTSGKLYFKFKNTDLGILNSYYSSTPAPDFIYYYIDTEDSVSWSDSYLLNFGNENGKWVSYSDLGTSGTEAYWLNQSKYGPLLEY